MPTLSFNLPPYGDELYYYEPSDIFKALGYDVGFEDSKYQFAYLFSPWGGDSNQKNIPIIEKEWDYRLNQSICLQMELHNNKMSTPTLIAAYQSRASLQEKISSLNKIRFENHLMGCSLGSRYNGYNYSIMASNGVINNPPEINGPRYQGDHWYLCDNSEKWKNLFEHYGDDLANCYVEQEYEYRVRERAKYKVHLESLSAPIPYSVSNRLMERHIEVGDDELPLWMVVDQLRVEVNAMLLRRARYGLAKICSQFIKDNGFEEFGNLQSNPYNYEPYMSDTQISDEEED